MKSKSIKKNIEEFKKYYFDEIIIKHCTFKTKYEINLFKKLTLKIAFAYLQENNNLNRCINFVNLYLEFQDIPTDEINNTMFYLLFNLNQKEEIIISNTNIKQKNKIKFN